MCASVCVLWKADPWRYACTAALSDLVHHSWSDNSYEMITLYIEYRFEVHGYADNMRILAL